MKTYWYLVLFVLLFGALPASAQTDTAASDTATETKVVPKENYGHQLCIGFDAAQPVFNAIEPYRQGYEFEMDYYWHKEVYLVLESGFGKAEVNDSILSYTTNSTFLRLGFNKCFIARNSPTDWDMAFIGLRYGMSFINRSAGQYAIYDSVWGNNSGTIPAKNIMGAWIEITGGMRVALLKNFFAGWNIRGKFILNSNAFQQLAPVYVAGYGRGDKNAIFDFNLYLSYAIRWKKKAAVIAALSK